MNHSTRAHAKLSASGAERWTECPASVRLSEGVPDRDTIWSKEGTLAHEVLESILGAAKIKNSVSTFRTIGEPIPPEMVEHARKTATFIFGVHQRSPGSELLVESKVHLGFIDENMWGTFDGAVIELFGTLHVFDFKYGAGHVVSPKENLQAIFYGLGLAHRYDWNFKRVRLWIIQPRVQGFDGPAFWELSIQELRGYVEFFREAVRRVKENSDEFKEGRWCHFCKAKPTCPKKLESKLADGQRVFSPVNK